MIHDFVVYLEGDFIIYFEGAFTRKISKCQCCDLFLTNPYLKTVINDFCSIKIGEFELVLCHDCFTNLKHFFLSVLPDLQKYRDKIIYNIRDEESGDWLDGM